MEGRLAVEGVGMDLRLQFLHGLAALAALALDVLSEAGTLPLQPRPQLCDISGCRLPVLPDLRGGGRPEFLEAVVYVVGLRRDLLEHILASS